MTTVHEFCHFFNSIKAETQIIFAYKDVENEIFVDVKDTEQVIFESESSLNF